MTKYTGPRTITVEFHPYEVRTNAKGEARGWTYAHYQAHVDGRSWYGLSALCADREATVDPGDTKAAAKARKSAENLADRLDRDDALRPVLEANIGRFSREDGADLGGSGIYDKDTFHVGQLVAVYSRGSWRRTVVEKIGRTNVTVAYVTAVGGIVTRKSVPFGDAVPIYADGPAADPAMQRQMDLAEEKRQAAIAQHQADGTTPGYGTAPGDEYCRPCGRYHGPGAHVLTCRQCGETVGGLEIDAHMADHYSDPGIYQQPEPARHCSRHRADLGMTCNAAGHDADEPELTPERIDHLLAGLRTERSSLRARIPAGTNLRPELQTRLAAVEARIADLSRLAYLKAARSDGAIVTAQEREELDRAIADLEAAR